MSLDITFLQDMLMHDATAVVQLKALLLRERELLEQRKPDGMQEIILQKDRLLDGLAFNAKQRAQLLRASQLPNNLEGWITLLQRHPETQGLVTSWQSVTNEFVACQKENEINGRMINRSKQTLTQLLNLIRGQVAAPSLYTQKGSTTHHNQSHTIVKA